MKRFFLLIFFLVFFLTVVLAAQDKWINYSYTNAVLSIEHDGDYWWLGTEGGLVKFNESTHFIQVFNRGNSHIIANRIPLLSKDENNTLWLGSYHGISKFDGQTFTNYTGDNSGLLNNNIKHLDFEKYSGLWVVTDSALTFFDGSQWKHFRVDNDGDSLKYISAVHAASSAGLLFSLGSKVEFIRKDGSISDMGFGLTSYITDVGFDYMNNVVVTTRDGFWINGNEGWKHYTNGNSPLPSNYISQVETAPNGDLYFNLVQQGVAVFHFDGTWTIIPNEDGNKLNYLIRVYAEEKIAMSLAWPFLGLVIVDHPSEWEYTFSDNYDLNISPIHSNNVNTMVIANGKKYIATEGIDVLDAHNHLIRKYDWNDGDFYSLSNPTEYLAVDAWGNIWCADNLNVSLTKISGDNITLISEDSLGITDPHVTALHWEANRLPDGRVCGTLWAAFNGGNYYGMARYDSVWYKFPEEHPQYPTSFNGIERDNNNLLWFAGLNVYSYDGQNFTRYWQEAPVKQATAVARDSSGNLWFGGKPDEASNWPGGIMKYDGNTWTLFTSENSALPDDYVTSLAVDTSGNLWIGMNEGGVAERLPDGSIRVFNRDNSPLDNNAIEKIVVDPETNNLWILNREAGVFVYNEQSVTAIDQRANPEAMPTSIFLYPNYPNPFNPQTTIRFRTDRSGLVSLKVYDINGRLVKTLLNGFTRAGEYRLMFDGRRLASGMYWCRLSSGKTVRTIKMALIK